MHRKTYEPNCTKQHKDNLLSRIQTFSSPELLAAFIRSKRLTRNSSPAKTVQKPFHVIRSWQLKFTSRKIGCKSAINGSIDRFLRTKSHSIIGLFSWEIQH